MVITDDAARHPFLASLPPHVRNRRMGEVRVSSYKKRVIDGGSIRDFLATYCACFAAIAMFIA